MLNNTGRSARWPRHDLLVVEGDVVVHDTVLDQFDDCPNDYCRFRYWVGATYEYGLGCTRFRAALIAANLDLSTGQPTGSTGFPSRARGSGWTPGSATSQRRGLLTVYV